MHNKYNKVSNEYYFNKALDALFDGEVEIFNSIINKELTINSVDSLGNTFLHYACSQNNLSATMFLLNRSIDMYVLNDKSKWASDMAENDVSLHLLHLHMHDALVTKRETNNLMDRLRNKIVKQ